MSNEIDDYLGDIILRAGALKQEFNRLKDAIDSLWGEMPADNVKFLLEHRPELVELCHQIHEELWHE